jgi:hypothetical protein
LPKLFSPPRMPFSTCPLGKCLHPLWLSLVVSPSKKYLLAAGQSDSSPQLPYHVVLPLPQMHFICWFPCLCLPQGQDLCLIHLCFAVSMQSLPWQSLLGINSVPGSPNQRHSEDHIWKINLTRTHSQLSE